MIRFIPLLIIIGFCWFCYFVGKRVGLKRGRSEKNINHEKQIKELKEQIPSDELLQSLVVNSNLTLPKLQQELDELTLKK